MPRRRRNPSDHQEALPTKVALEVAKLGLRYITKQGGEGAIAGGLAMLLHGHVRNTSDVDIISTVDVSMPRRKGSLNIGGSTYVVDHPWGDVEIDMIVRSGNEKALYLEGIVKAMTLKGLPVVTPDYLAIMKITARRSKDEADFNFLAGRGLLSVANIRKIVNNHYDRGADFLMEEIEMAIESARWEKEREDR